MVTRSKGYELARGKEDAAIAVARDCIKHVMGIEAHVIENPERNRRHGDLELVGTAECKGQPVDPDRYAQNFVEVFEDVTALQRPKHQGGFSRVEQILCLRPGELERVVYKDFRVDPPVRKPVGRISHVSCSLESIAGSDLTIYANPDPQRTFVYFYTRDFLLDHVRKKILANDMRRAQGASNDDTFAVLVPVSPARWQRIAGTWKFVGRGRPPVNRIREALTRSEDP